MRFSYSTDLQRNFPARITGILVVCRIHDRADTSSDVGRFTDIAAARLAQGSEGTHPEIQAWRRAYATMGLKPTQFRCAAEALLRRYRKEGNLPLLHPVVDLCNAASLAYSVPIAVFDLSKIVGNLTVRQAKGTERYATFADTIEAPDADEIIFADDAGNAHARRWANRQSKLSAVRAGTSDALIIAEGLHDKAAEDIARLIQHLGSALDATYGVPPVSELLLLPDAVFDHDPAV